MIRPKALIIAGPNGSGRACSVFNTSDEIRLCYRRGVRVVAQTVPEYLRHSLLEPLTEREQLRRHIEGQLKPGEALELPDEEAGSYQGIIRVCTPHYVLQEIAPGRCIRHDILLLKDSLEVDVSARITYQTVTAG